LFAWDVVQLVLPQPASAPGAATGPARAQCGLCEQ
jgi:hypothetical protein